MIKTIRTTIVLGEGEFADGTNTRIIEGLATTVDIEKAGLPDKNTAKVKIANLNLAEMEQLTFLAFRPLQSRKNKIMIEAGEKGKELSVVFKELRTSLLLLLSIFLLVLVLLLFITFSSSVLKI